MLDLIPQTYIKIYFVRANVYFKRVYQNRLMIFGKLIYLKSLESAWKIFEEYLEFFC